MTVIIEAKVFPKSRKEEIIKTGENQYKVKLTEAAEKGKANKKLVKLLADYFKVARSKIIIVKGEKSHRKIISILN